MVVEIWSEKYRPKALEEIINQKHVVERLKAFVKERSIPNMLFAGPPGVGKTCAAICLARELFGENWRRNFQETNASDMRGIDVIRTRIKSFSRIKPIGAEYKIIFLDESDSLTPEAQAALRRLMEMYADVTRFILSCNYSSKIIEPIRSRTMVFRFKPLDRASIKEFVNRIEKGEGIRVSEEALDTLIEITQGDLRKVANILQSSAILGKKIDKETILNITARVKPKEVRDMIELALKGEFKKARDKLTDLLINKGLAGIDLIKEIHSMVFDLNLKEEDKVKLIDKIGEYEFRIVEGSNAQIQ